MLEIACVAGLLIFNTTAFNPNNINSINAKSDNVIVRTSQKHGNYYFDADSEKEAKEAWEYTLEAWRECKKEWNK